MADKQRPGLSARAQAEAAARRDREAAALRANLRRRKAQAVERVVVEGEPVAREESGERE